MGIHDYQNVRIFISYAHEDTQAANRLYNDFKMSGLDPWLDTQSLLGGQNWRIAIKEAIKNSRYFIPLLSSNSVEKIAAGIYPSQIAVNSQGKLYIADPKLNAIKVLDIAVSES